MSRRLISTGSPFEQRYGYSRAVIDGGFVFVAGTTGYDYARMALPEDAAEQARNSFRTIATVLAEAGSGLDRLVRIQIFVTGREEIAPVLTVMGELLREIRPAAGFYIVAGLLEPGMKVEIEATASHPAG